MAKSLTITIQDDASALELLEEFCYNNKYESKNLENETKLDFLKRCTIDWWIGQASQGKNRRTFVDQISIFKTMVID